MHSPNLHHHHSFNNSHLDSPHPTHKLSLPIQPAMGPLLLLLLLLLWATQAQRLLRHRHKHLHAAHAFLLPSQKKKSKLAWLQRWPHYRMAHLRYNPLPPLPLPMSVIRHLLVMSARCHAKDGAVEVEVVSVSVNKSMIDTNENRIVEAASESENGIEEATLDIEIAPPQPVLQPLLHQVLGRSPIVRCLASWCCLRHTKNVQPSQLMSSKSYQAPSPSLIQP